MRCYDDGVEVFRFLLSLFHSERYKDTLSSVGYDLDRECYNRYLYHSSS
jgi:hypothetical protein